MHLLESFHVSINRACSVVNLQRSMWYYQSKRDDSQVIDKLNELAEQLPTRGFDEYYNRIRREGLKWNRKTCIEDLSQYGIKY